MNALLFGSIKRALIDWLMKINEIVAVHFRTSETFSTIIT